jgi:hypothetical protein
MVALGIAILGTIVSVGIIVAVASRRPVGTPLTWGEAMVAAVFVFWLMFLIYGIVPHQWLTFADNEWQWRKDKILLGPGKIVDKLPFTMTYEAIRDFVAVGIYGVGLAGHVGLWIWWQNRGKQKPKELPTSAYGRPLVKRGAAGGTA